MRVGLLIILLGAVATAVAEEPIRIGQTREMRVGNAGSHELRLSLYLFRGGRWAQEEVEAAVRESAALLAQCGVALSRAQLSVVEAPPPFRVYFTPVSRELLRRLPVSKPAIFFVDDTRNDPAFDAEAIGRGNAAGRPELADTVWVAYGARDLPQALAHELVHILSDSGAHSVAPANLMQAQTLPENTHLTAAQCDQVRAKGQANGLLEVN